jgi:hypothetical protein
MAAVRLHAGKYGCISLHGIDGRMRLFRYDNAVTEWLRIYMLKPNIQQWTRSNLLEQNGDDQALKETARKRLAIDLSTSIALQAIRIAVRLTLVALF